MPSKLDQAAQYGFDIELFYEDLLYVAKGWADEPSPEHLRQAAHIVHSLCKDRGIAIVCLQPFMHYEGLRDRQKHAQRLEEMKLWIELVKILDTHIISIPSTTLSKDEMSGDLSLIVADLREVADLGAPDGIEFAYESLCWGTHSDTWEQSWRIVQMVDRDNFGICLDTFNMAGRVYADPAAPLRKTPNAEKEMQKSIDRLIHSVDPSKIVFVQVVDAEYLQEPLVEGHEYFDPEQPSRMSWSRNCRLFYGEVDRGAYLPIREIMKALLVDLGWEGWISAEMFNRSLVDAHSSTPAEHARRAHISWEKIKTDFELRSSKVQERTSIRLPEPARAQL